jgi:hypothetical protein
MLLRPQPNRGQVRRILRRLLTKHAYSPKIWKKLRGLHRPLDTLLHQTDRLRCGTVCTEHPLRCQPLQRIGSSAKSQCYVATESTELPSARSNDASNVLLSVLSEISVAFFLGNLL